MQQVYGNDFLSSANVFLWHKRFLKGREGWEDDNRQGRSISAMLITFFDSKGIIHREFVRNDLPITGAYYLEVLKRFMARIFCIRPEYRDPETWSLLHDNAPSHTSLQCSSIFASKSSMCVELSAVFNWFVPVRFPSILKIEIEVERMFL